MHPADDSSTRATVRTSLVAGQLQAAACVRITYRQLRHGASVLIAYRLGQTNGRIAVSFNAPPPTATGHNDRLTAFQYMKTATVREYI